MSAPTKLTSPPKLITSPLRKWGRTSGSKAKPKKSASAQGETPTSTPRFVDECSSEENNEGHDDEFPDLEVLRRTASFGGEGSSERGQFAGLVAPMNMCFTPAGDVIIADTGNHRLAVLSVEGELRELIGEGSLRHPRGVACDASAIYVSEPGANGRVQRMRLPEYLRRAGAETPRGAHLGTLEAQNEHEGPGGLTFPQGLCLGHSKLYVADCEDHRIVAYDAQTLRYDKSFGAFGDGEAELDFPYSMAVHEDEIFVADVGNHRVQVFSREGAFVRFIGAEGDAPGEFRNPRGVIVVNGLLVVLEAKRMQVLTVEGQPRQHIEIDGALDLWGICAQGDNVLVSDKGAHAVYVFKVQSEYVYLALRDGRLPSIVSTYSDADKPAETLAPPAPTPVTTGSPDASSQKSPFSSSPLSWIPRWRSRTKMEASPVSVSTQHSWEDDGLEGGNSPASLARRMANHPAVRSSFAPAPTRLGNPHPPPLRLSALSAEEINTSERSSSAGGRSADRKPRLADAARSYRGPYTPDAHFRV
uniref:SMP-30/Gluconolactonase/LRE-like region domain-containing protein n=1 Tax=Haptolina ericina TaxID=156174 RepID=A0A7S3B6J3_9EUKA|mmetsp:Transcript_52300/g.117488  ORF Transcript_52300/g.117488 Transcript_52300/m.117488 type:complete len:530 (+) Transcript_52300:29-1618(+)